MTATAFGRRGRATLTVVLASVVALLLAPGAALADDPPAEISDVALDSARDLDDFLEALPEEADRIGVDRATIPELQVVAVFKVHMIDERFAEQTDKRDLDEAITPTDLWWVVLGTRGKLRDSRFQYSGHPGRAGPPPSA